MIIITALLIASASAQQQSLEGFEKRGTFKFPEKYKSFFPKNFEHGKVMKLEQQYVLAEYLRQNGIPVQTLELKTTPKTFFRDLLNFYGSISQDGETISHKVLVASDNKMFSCDAGLILDKNHDLKEIFFQDCAESDEKFGRNARGIANLFDEDREAGKDHSPAKSKKDQAHGNKAANH